MNRGVNWGIEGDVEGMRGVMWGVMRSELKETEASEGRGMLAVVMVRRHRKASS